MNATPQRQVHPAASAVLILLVLVGVQWAWWRFLVWRPPPISQRGVQGPSGSGPPEVRMPGRADVTVQTVAGAPQPGDTDGPAHAARYDRPTGIALDAAGNLYVADTGNHKIRIVSPTGETGTVAGRNAGFADGAVREARFNAPCGVCVDPAGTIYVADTGNHSIRRIKDGQVTTLVGGPSGGNAAGLQVFRLLTGIAYVPGATPILVVPEADGGRVLEFTTDGKLLGSRATPGAPVSVAGSPESAAIPSPGTLALGSVLHRNIPLAGTEDASDAAAARIKLTRPLGLAAMGKGWLVTDAGHGAVMIVNNGKAKVLAGVCSTGDPQRGFRDGDGRSCQFGVLTGVVFDGKRFVYVTDTGNNSIRRLDVSEMASQ